MAKETKKTKKEYISTLGRRRTASARVRLHKGTEESTVNGIVIGKYFAGPAETLTLKKPLSLSGLSGKYYITAKVIGGGKRGQLEAIVHGIARAVVELDSEKYRETIKAAGLLTRDSRIRERRMVGTGGKSRRAKQSPKR